MGVDIAFAGRRAARKFQCSFAPLPLTRFTLYGFKYGVIRRALA
jgi:hypothetical protein